MPGWLPVSGVKKPSLRGQALEPLYKSMPVAARRDGRLHMLLAFGKREAAKAAVDGPEPTQHMAQCTHHTQRGHQVGTVCPWAT